MSKATGRESRPWSRILAVAMSAAVLGGVTAAPSAADPLLEPLTDAEWSAHVREVDQKVGEAMAQGLSTDVTHTLNGDRENWLPERVAQQRQIARELYSRGALVPDEGQALFTGGLPGAGKTTALNQNSVIDSSEYLALNSDDAKEKLCEHGMIPEIDGIAPMEAAELIQRESSRIADMVAGMAAAEGKNVIWDTTMGSNRSLDNRLDALRDSGYRNYAALFLDVPIEVSLQRVDQRHREGYEKYRNGDRCEGRHVPASIIEAQADPEYNSVNRRVFEDHKADFDRWYLYDATNIPAVLLDHS
jgi:thymidylate kinase